MYILLVVYAKNILINFNSLKLSRRRGAHSWGDSMDLAHRVARWPWSRPLFTNVAVKNFWWPWKIGGREWP